MANAGENCCGSPGEANPAESAAAVAQSENGSECCAGEAEKVQARSPEAVAANPRSAATPPRRGRRCGCC